MTDAAPPSVEHAAARHAQHIVAGRAADVARDCVPQVLQEPPDLYTQLSAVTFEHYTILGQARIGAQHVFKVRYIGATVITVQHRFGTQNGQWVVLESERV